MGAIQPCGCCGKALRPMLGLSLGCPECMDCEHLPCCHGACQHWAAFSRMWTDVARLIRGNHPMQLFGSRLRGAKMIGR